jgi:hypothetical protein
MKRLQVLRRVSHRLLAGARQLVDRARRLSEEIEQLEPARSGERLAHQRDRFEKRFLVVPR